MKSFPKSNRTFQILSAAKKGGYAVGGFCCYNDDGVMAVIRAAEIAQSPAIIQLFPWSMNFQGPSFVRYVVDAAHSAKVPVAVHLDHCIEAEDVKMALELPFDSIMIDASLGSIENNIRECKRIVHVAKAKGMCIEAEMGRIEGGEDGLPTVDLDAIMTEPAAARQFIKETGVQFLAPSFGNIHGIYGKVRPEESWRLPLLEQVREEIPEIPLVLHGTHEISDELFMKSRQAGITKINLNKTVRHEYTEFIAENAGKLELTVLKTQGIEIYTKSIIRVMEGFLDSAGKTK